MGANICAVAVLTDCSMNSTKFITRYKKEEKNSNSLLTKVALTAKVSIFRSQLARGNIRITVTNYININRTQTNTPNIQYTSNIIYIYIIYITHIIHIYNKRKLTTNKVDVYNKPEIADASSDSFTNIGQKLVSQIPKSYIN